MRNTTAALRKELGDGFGVDELPPPLPLMQRSKGESASRPPRTGFGDAVPCCKAPTHLLIHAPPEPLANAMTKEHRELLIAKLKQYDLERNDPNVALSPLFINRVVYDCTAAAIFSRRWIVGKVTGPHGQTMRCQCANCVMYSQPSATTSAHHYGLSSSPSFGSLERASDSDPQASSACNGMWQTEVRSYYTPSSRDDSTLVFESRFESGNLRTAFQVSEQEYDLTIRPDFNTTHHTQTYYFSVRNTRRNKVYKFNMINFVKPASLYNSGMQPLVYSTRASQEKDNPKGWYRSGSNICYYQNHIARGSSRQKFYYTLSFTVEFPYENDTVYFAYKSVERRQKMGSISLLSDTVLIWLLGPFPFCLSYPYTYTALNRDLHLLESDPVRSRYLKRRVLCKSLAGNDVDLLTITNFATPEEEIRARRGVVYTARVHPGESNSSWIMRGALEFLTSEDPIAVALRDRFVYKIVPMLNVDGVVAGNYRCSLAGVDLNRHWKTPSPTIHPTIYATKQMIKRMAAVRPILMCVDLHGHSRKMNVFVYGCPIPTTSMPLSSPSPDSTPVLTSTLSSSLVSSPASTSISASSKLSKKLKRARREKERRLREREEELADPRRMMERVFPRMMAEPVSIGSGENGPLSGHPNGDVHPSRSASPSPLDHLQLTPTSFSLRDCSFHISRGKDSTARVVLWRELGQKQDSWHERALLVSLCLISF
jgi:hypothetical protein